MREAHALPLSVVIHLLTQCPRKSNLTMQFSKVHENIQLGIKISKKAAIQLLQCYFCYQKKSFLLLEMYFSTYFLKSALFKSNGFFQNHVSMKPPNLMLQKPGHSVCTSGGHFSFHPAGSALMTWCQGIFRDSSRRGKLEHGSRIPFFSVDRSLEPLICKNIVFSYGLRYKREVQDIKQSKPEENYSKSRKGGGGYSLNPHFWNSVVFSKETCFYFSLSCFHVILREGMKKIPKT